ncbi:MAG TPA: sigma 54-interacting transcriptional regulator [Gemmatimonadales bacterium]|nr:sigma 54-interacting transcriptional regulator [Gemmatimonadales bacterium]
MRRLFETRFAIAMCSVETAASEVRSAAPDLIVVATGLPWSDGHALAQALDGEIAPPPILLADRSSTNESRLLLFPLPERGARQGVAPNPVGRRAVRELVGRSVLLRNVIEQARIVGPTEASVLITGESGTGKELVARAIHEQSPRRRRPLEIVNCACIPRELFESEFFGHVKGAFTGAVRDRVGRFEAANGGSILLDEVAEIPLELQGKLLRVLEGGHVQRVGEDRTHHVNVRAIAATNQNLAHEVERGRFRRDLYYRLCVFPIHVPSLRERREDIALLARHFLRRAAERLGEPEVPLSNRDLAVLQAHDWPGNVRELLHVMERAAILARNGLGGVEVALQMGGARVAGSAQSDGRQVDETTHVGEATHVAEATQVADATRIADATHPSDATTDRVLTQIEMQNRERSNLLEALRCSGWKLYGPGGAAQLVGVKPTTLASRLRRFGIERRHRHKLSP